jgi:hypothetical protein
MNGIQPACRTIQQAQTVEPSQTVLRDLIAFQEIKEYLPRMQDEFLKRDFSRALRLRSGS